MKLAPILSAALSLLLAACGADFGGSAAKGDDYASSVEQADEARKAGNYDIAIPLYGRALQAKPDGVEAKLGLGQAYLSIGAPEEAAAVFRDVLAKRTGDAAARRGLATALISTGQTELAERQLEVTVNGRVIEDTLFKLHQLYISPITLGDFIAQFVTGQCQHFAFRRNDVCG